MLTALLALALTPAAQAGTLADDVSNSLEAMRSVYAVEYAPADWKKHYLGYDLNTEFDKAVDSLRSRPLLTQFDARNILKDFVYAMHDYHVSIKFLSTESAKLPLTIHAGEGRYFIVDIDRAKLSESAFPFHIGDEVVSFDGKSMAQAIQEVASQMTPNIAGTDAALNELSLTSRSGARGMRVPQGPITLKIIRKGETAPRGIQLIWDYTPELINPRANIAGRFASLNKERSPAFHPMMTSEFSDLADEDSPQAIGAKVTFTPALGEKIWTAPADNTFDAYIFKDASGARVGYVRIAGYIEPDYVKAIADFREIVKVLQANTDKLVIDQVNNPGGSVFYVYTLASMLTDQPLLNPRHHMAVTQSDVKDALDVIDQLKDVKNEADALKALKPTDLDGYPASYEVARFMLNNANFVISEFNAGKRITSPYFIGGVDHINPAAVAYTKPILLLVNHLDFSGGDFFPSILQDNKRVTVLGSRTSGAGGYVADVKIPNNVGIEKFRVTESIAERADGNPIENLGVTPDIVHEMTANDLANNYADYVKAIQEALKAL